MIYVVNKTRLQDLHTLSRIYDVINSKLNVGIQRMEISQTKTIKELDQYNENFKTIVSTLIQIELQNLDVPKKTAQHIQEHVSVYAYIIIYM